MAQSRIRIVDVAEALGLSTATVLDFYALTTIHQDASYRAKTAIACLEAMRDGLECETSIVLPVELVKRESTRVL